MEWLSYTSYLLVEKVKESDLTVSKAKQSLDFFLFFPYGFFLIHRDMNPYSFRPTGIYIYLYGMACTQRHSILDKHW
jgi:hypothetical protein